MAIRPQNKQVTYALHHSRAPNLLRMYHANITQNHRARRVGSIKMPSIVTRAHLIVDQRAFVPTVTQKVDE